jgi:hypothetical protein
MTEVQIRTPQRSRFDPVRAAVRLAFSITVCGLVPASNVNWLAGLQTDSSPLVALGPIPSRHGRRSGWHAASVRRCPIEMLFG